jgi:hypothetical protein
VNEKIIVTEEQANVIEGELSNSEFERRALAYNIALRIDDIKQHLDLVTIARIVEGEPYEIAYEFKVGDIVKWKNTGAYFEITEDVMYPRDRWYFTVSIATVKKGKSLYALVCKAENREDLRHD